jgi:UDP-glucuronate 4-epimerase
MSNVLITGGAGFIGFHQAKHCLENGHRVTVIDNLNSYYDKELKLARISNLAKYDNFLFHNLDLKDTKQLSDLFKSASFEFIYHFAAQAGVRYSFENPEIYFSSNVEGTYNLLETARQNYITKIFFSSTSSVYGDTKPIPFKESNKLQPIQFYALTKILGEELCAFFSKTYNLDITVFRFFTVYGPWGRPDMALFKFTDAILRDSEISLFNHGNHSRSFTYIDDVIHFLSKALTIELPQKFNVINLGNPKSVSLLHLIDQMEKIIGKKFLIKNHDIQPGDMINTLPDLKNLNMLLGNHLFTPIDVGVRKFLDWHRFYYPVKWEGLKSNLSSS